MISETDTSDKLHRRSSIDVALQLILWTASAFLIGLSIYGFTSNGLFEQVVWIDGGLARFAYLALIFTVAGGIFALLGQRYFRLVLVLLGLLALWATAGAGAIGGGLLCFLSFLSIGDILLGRNRDRASVVYDAGIAIAAGGAVFVALFEYTANLKLHYSFVYLLVLAVSAAVNWRGLRYWLVAVKEWVFPPSPHTRFEFALEVAISFFFFFYILLIAKPEISADALAQHLTLPTIMANSHRFTFNFHQFVWAFAPMGSDWLYSLGYGIGGEFAARLLNFGFLCGTTLLTFGLVKEVGASRLLGLFCTLLWLSTPLVNLVTGSLFSENFIAFLSIGSLGAICAFYKTAHRGYLIAFSVLFGGALASKFGAIAFFVPLVPCAIWVAWKTRGPATRYPQINSRFWSAFLLVALVIVVAAPPYLRAWLHTGNPFFPFMNVVFKSPYFFTGTIESRYHGAIDPRIIYAMTYKLGYLESQKGSFGFEYLVLIPLTVLALRRSWSFAARLSVFVSIGFLFASMSYIAYSRYLYAGLPLVMVGSAAMLEDLRKKDVWLYRSLFALGLLCVLLNAYFLPASGWYQKEGFFDPFHEEEDRRAYLVANSPRRELIAYLNAKDPGATVAFLAEPAIAGLKGTPLTYNWYNLSFFNEIHQSPNANAVAEHMARDSIKYFVGHPVEQMTSDTSALRTFVAEYLVPDYTVNGSVLFRWRTFPSACFGVHTACTIPPPEPLPQVSPFQPRPGNTIKAVPNPIIVSDGSGLGEALIVWSSTADRVDIRAGTRNGALFAMGGPAGNARTGKWVSNGATFYLQNHDAPDPTSESATLAILKVSVR